MNAEVWVILTIDIDLTQGRNLIEYTHNANNELILSRVGTEIYVK